jgi:hypothetical protein
MFFHPTMLFNAPIFAMHYFLSFVVLLTLSWSLASSKIAPFPPPSLPTATLNCRSVCTRRTMAQAAAPVDFKAMEHAASPQHDRPESETENATVNSVPPYRFIAPAGACAVPLVSEASQSNLIAYDLDPTEDTWKTRKRKVPDPLNSVPRSRLDRAVKQAPGTFAADRPVSLIPQLPVIVPNQAAAPFRLVSSLVEANEQVSTVSCATKLDLLQLQRQAMEAQQLGALADEADARVVITVVPGKQGDHWSSKYEPSDAPAQRPAMVPFQATLSAVPFDWAAGMTCVSGITYVDPVAAAAGPRPPTVAVGMPARWRPAKRPKPAPKVEKEHQVQPTPQPRKVARTESKATPTSRAATPTARAATPVERRERKYTLPVDAEEAVTGAVQYLQVMARTIGRTPALPVAEAHIMAAEGRTHQAHLVHALLARDGRLVDKLQPVIQRRSGRVRQAPEAFVPPLVIGKPGRRQEDNEEVDPASVTDVRVGPGYQCLLPSLRPRPAAPTEEEGSRYGTLVAAPGWVLGRRQGVRGIVGVQDAGQRHVAELLRLCGRGLMLICPDLICVQGRHHTRAVDLPCKRAGHRPCRPLWPGHHGWCCHRLIVAGGAGGNVQGHARARPRLLQDRHRDGAWENSRPAGLLLLRCVEAAPGADGSAVVRRQGGQGGRTIG